MFPISEAAGPLLPSPTRDPRGVPRPTVASLRKHLRRVRPAHPEQKLVREKRLKAPLRTPSCGAQTRGLVWLYCLGLGQVAAAPFGLFTGGESDAESLKVSENTVQSFLLGVGVGIPTFDWGPPGQERAPPTVASPSPSRLQHPWRVLDRAWCRCLG